MSEVPHASRHATLRRFWNALAAELAVVAIGGSTYVVVRELTEGDPTVAVEHARRLLQLERALGVAWEPSIQAFAIDHRVLRTLVNWIYIWGHWPFITLVTFGLYLLRRDLYRRLRNAVFVSGLIGFVFFAFLPMAPPRLTGVGMLDTITAWSSSYRVLQPPTYTNLYAAMPSLHFGWDLLVGVTLFLSSRNLVLRCIAFTMPAAMAFAVVATANHWILDVVVGFFVVATGAAVAERADAAYHRRWHRGAEPRTRAPEIADVPALHDGARSRSSVVVRATCAGRDVQ